jgi:hypothetical protein
MVQVLDYFAGVGNKDTSQLIRTPRTVSSNLSDGVESTYRALGLLD